MRRPHGWGRWRRFRGALAVLTICAGLALGGTALGAGETITTVAGDGNAAFGGDGGTAVLASLHHPEGVSAMPGGGYLIAEKDNHRVRHVSPSGMISTVAGTGSGGYSGDGIAATTAKLNKPEGVAALADGGFLIADTGNHRIRHVAPGGTISTVAGIGSSGYNGDDQPAVGAKVDSPRGVAATLDGGYLIADTGNRRVRRVSPLGTITTVAGTGEDGSGGDGGPAVDAELDEPDDVAPTTDGGFLIADYGRHVVRRVSPLGTISTVAGQSGQSGSSGNGGPAAEAELNGPTDVEPLPLGGFLITEHGGNQVRRVGPDGILGPFAGAGGGGGFAGDEGAAAAAELDGPHAASLTHAGDVLIADSHNQRIRAVDADFLAPPPADPSLGPPADPPAEPSAGEAAEVTPVAPPTQPALPEPVKGVSVTVMPGFGQVMIRVPGAAHWSALDRGASLPVGSLVKALDGSVVLASALGAGRSQAGTFWGGIFQVRQARHGSGITDLVLRGGDFSRCAKTARRGTRASASGKRRRPGRRLWGKDDHGRFRTHGRDSVATTRGTLWSTEDRCKGTLTRVHEGQVLVRHRHTRKRVLVSAGERHLAPRSR